MAGYGWDEYDVRKGGRHTVHDVGNHLDMQTEFVKVPGGSNGGSWAVRIKGTPREDAPPDLKTAVVFYAGMEGVGSLEVANEVDTTGYDDTVTLEGSTSGLGDFKIDITRGPATNSYPRSVHPSYQDKPLDRTMVSSKQVPDDGHWQAKTALFMEMKTDIDKYVAKYGEEDLPPPWQMFTIPNEPGQGNLHFVEKVFEGPFEFDVLYSSGSAVEPVTSEIITETIQSVIESFSERFTRIFAPKAPFTEPAHLKFSKELFSNLIGGIGYFYGDSVVDRSYAPEYEEENEGFWQDTAEARARGNEKLEGPSELFTSIPSRPFFPRGFLWDEGFHLLPVVDWDIDLALDIVKSWFNLMDDDGWIGREQILGPEARSKVPTEFQVQYPHYANPPTLFLVVEAFIDKLALGSSKTQPADEQLGSQDSPNLYTAYLENPEVSLQYLRDLYPLLKRQYEWFRKTQWGDIKGYDRDAFSSKEGYRWRGRSPEHILTSGLDDYPRAQPPHPGELHVDLMSWVGMMARSLKRIASTLDEDDDAAEFAAHEHAITRNLDDLHWDEAAQAYCDATIDAYEEHVTVCHRGYVSLFPFLLGLVGLDSPRLGAMLDLLADPEQLWSPYGIRSLSKQDEHYGTEENYWRSPIWVNVNFLAVTRLHDLARTPSSAHSARATRLYNALRTNLVSNVFAQWQATGFAWEQYNPDTGAGQRTQHFTGWTSLVVKIMAMEPLEEGSGESGKGVRHDEL
ncbi:MAG: Processing alpha glucosidase I [Thelocarpon impressellum]|nr:MAG: Processing alpha glucosidase I [Thelocarpon impressellum]